MRVERESGEVTGGVRTGDRPNGEGGGGRSAAEAWHCLTVGKKQNSTVSESFISMQLIADTSPI